MKLGFFLVVGVTILGAISAGEVNIRITQFMATSQISDN